MEFAHVNTSLLSTCIGKMVSMIGKVQQVLPNKMEVKAVLSDGGEITLKLYEQNNDLSEGCFFHAVVRVESNNVVTAQKLVPFVSSDFDMSLYNDAIQHINSFPMLFKNKSL